jgi:hypothetical protein
MVTDYAEHANIYEVAQKKKKKMQGLLRKTTKSGNNKNWNLFQFYAKNVYTDSKTLCNASFAILSLYL